MHVLDEVTVPGQKHTSREPQDRTVTDRDVGAARRYDAVGAAHQTCTHQRYPRAGARLRSNDPEPTQIQRDVIGIDVDAIQASRHLEVARELVAARLGDDEREALRGITRGE